MRLPFIVDVALGLIFIYLILSLLASELQELLTTLLQWRAQHLRKSIEILLGGDVKASEDVKVIELTNKIYDNPLIKSINQEAKGFLAVLPRKITWAIASVYNMLFKRKSYKLVLSKQTTFGNNKQHSAPSYIPADSFAITLMDSLHISKVVDKLMEIRLDKFKDQRLKEIKKILLQLQNPINNNELPSEFVKDIVHEFDQLNLEYTGISEDFKNNKYEMRTSIERMGYSLDKYIENFQENIEYPQEFLEKTIRQLKSLRREFFDNVDRSILLAGLIPNINEVVQSINGTTAVYEEIKLALQDKDSETYQTIQSLINSLPKSVVTNIELMAKRAQSRAETVEEGIKILQKEIERSFDSSMERAGGVYKRNAKGVAILIGVALAVTANADTFHIISRLSKDTVLREAIVYKATELDAQRYRSSDLPNLDTNQILGDVTLPIGWTNANIQQQMSWETFRINGLPILNILTMISGWLITGMAIAMGAPFWFDLLSKVMNVRNAGKSGKSSRNRDED
ncbi:hypothetical protein VB711_16065 [Cronbergia sp. UHCC 0137]|uniref:hypothetical protein n=1 Tax=Cronbergia sp. UHCC 0137 TaxID=3110239 RepID=UPI002B2133E5|nr:hypothetical protein [Cronbergia sp. UHCC 0137]MEA5619345.1 hypothetical protein [Cronbergia sp. UHCC 0137]